ncbi:hypothetical protein SHIRM173S_03571 [Streptomyces hirsutus]
MEADGLDLGPHGLLVESFLDGDEFLIEALAWDDEVYLGSIVDRVTAEGDTFDDDVHHAPTALTPERIEAVHEVVAAGARAQGLVRSVMHAEVRFHDGRPHLVEIAVRPGGGGLDHMARVSAGYDPIAAVADVARGIRPRAGHYAPTGVHTAAMCLLPPSSGRIGAIHVPDRWPSRDDLFFLKLTAKPGEPGPPPAGGQQHPRLPRRDRHVLRGRDVHRRGTRRPGPRRPHPTPGVIDMTERPVITVGFVQAAVTSLAQLQAEGSVIVIDEPDVIRNRDLAAQGRRGARGPRTDRLGVPARRRRRRVLQHPPRPRPGRHRPAPGVRHPVRRPPRRALAAHRGRAPRVLRDKALLRKVSAAAGILNPESVEARRRPRSSPCT